MKTNLAARCLRTGLVLALPLTLLLLAGCSGSSKTSTVSGKVTYKDQPVTGGTIKLYPTDGSGSPLEIPIKADGTFSTTDVPPGSMQVAIETESAKLAGGGYKPVTGGGVKPPSNDSRMKGPEVDTSGQPKYVPIPKKYADPKTSGLTWDIVKGKNDKTFPLMD